MNQEPQAGDKIQYMLPDKQGKPHWFDGIIHAVRNYSFPDDGKGSKPMIKNVTYLIDTGRDVRVDEYTYDVRSREIDRRVAIEQAKGADPLQATKAVANMPDLPKSKTVVEQVRQPEQIELPYESLRTPQ